MRHRDLFRRLTGTGPTRCRRALRLLASSLVAIPSLFAACSPGYVLRAGWEEFRILQRREPIREVVHDTALAPELRRKLRLVVDAREFAHRELRLEPKDSFSSFARVPSDTLLLVVTAAYPYRLQWKTWWFPIVGRVPYRGYFDFEEARREARRLEEEGFDVDLRPTSAFSTLGWLPDPVLSTTLAADSVSIVETVIHEITHTTFFPAGQADFNESFANFVGHRGAVDFFCDALRDDALCRSAELRWHDTRIFGRFFQETVDGFRELYARSLPDSVMEHRKRERFRRAADRYEREVRPSLRAGRYGTLDPERLNNAWLLGRILYYRGLDDLERIYRDSDGRLDDAVRRVIDAVRASSRRPPWEVVDDLVSDLPAAGPDAASASGR